MKAKAVLVLIFVVAVASGCVFDSGTEQDMSNQELDNQMKSNNSESQNTLDDSTDNSSDDSKNISGDVSGEVNDTSPDSYQASSDGEGTEENTTNSETLELSYTGTSRELDVEEYGPRAIASGPEGDYWLVSRGTEREDNYVRRFSEGWQSMQEPKVIYPEEKMINDIHFAEGNWWVLAGLGEKEVFKFTENWEYTGDSHELSKEGVESIYYDEGWIALVNAKENQIFRYDENWELKDSFSILNESVDNHFAVSQGEDGYWRVIAGKSKSDGFGFDFLLASFDKNWNLQNVQNLDRGTPADLLNEGKDWWLFDTTEMRTLLYR